MNNSVLYNQFEIKSEMKDSTSLLEQQDFVSLRKMLKEEGYLLFRGILNKEDILNCRKTILGYLAREHKLVDSNCLQKSPPEDANIFYGTNNISCGSGIFLTGNEELQNNENIKQLIENPTLFHLISKLLGGPCATFKTKWIRVLGHKEFTDEHSDFYKFERFANEMFTCWIPLGNYQSNLHSTLTICHQSHRFSTLIASQQKEELPDEYLEKKLASQVEWLSTDFQIGDLIIFDIKLIHASTLNLSPYFRLSIDTRWKVESLLQPFEREAFQFQNNI